MAERRFSGQAGSDYDASRAAIPDNEKLQETLAQQLGVVERILELGCGTGYTTTFLLDHASHIQSVDNEPVMLDQARDVLHTPIEEGIVELVEDDILSFLRVAPSNSYDAVVSAMTLHNLLSDTRHDIHAEILRVLKPGGLFVNADKYAQQNQKHQQDLMWQLEEFKRVFSDMGREELIDEWTNHYLADEHPDVIMKEDETLIELEELGFGSVDIIYRNRLEAVLVAQK